MTWLSPRTGQPLHQAGPHALTDGAERWPVIDGIAYLRLGREGLRDAALALLDANDIDGATALLLADQDDWWTGAAADPADLATLDRDRDRLTLRDAMALLAWGRVADYFLHRWSDPTYLAGLALIEAHWTATGRAFELACGIGHHLRTLAQAGVRVMGADVVFAKLWIAHHFVVPEAELVCFDASADWPVADAFDLVTCHDAFYFLEPKPAILARLRALPAPGGLLAISHIHNRDWPNLSAGSAVSRAELDALFPDATIYDDAELTRALAEARAPVPGAPADAEAFSLVVNAGPPRPVTAGLALPPQGAPLRRNPLYGPSGTIAWPSDRYAREYGPRATYPARATCPPSAVLNDATIEWARSREMVNLPERW